MSLLSGAFDTGTYVVTRYPGQDSVDESGHTVMPAGVIVPGGVTGSVQPLSGRALRDLKEGKRADDVRWLFSETPLYTTDENHAQQDYVDVPDDVDATVIRRFRVTKVEYFGVISGHFRITLEKVSTP